MRVVGGEAPADFPERMVEREIGRRPRGLLGRGDEEPLARLHLGVNGMLADRADPARAFRLPMENLPGTQREPEVEVRRVQNRGGQTES